MNWNPNSPLLIGNEQSGDVLPAESVATLSGGVPTVNANQTYSAPGSRGLLVPVVSTAAQTIDQLALRGTFTPGAHYVAEAFVAGNEAIAGYTLLECVPSSGVEVGTIGGSYTDIACTSTAFIAGTCPVGQASFNGLSSMTSRFTIPGAVAGKRILGVGVNVTGYSYDPYGGPTSPANLRIGLVMTAGAADPYTLQTTFTQTVATGDNPWSVSFGEINPLTGRPWTAADITAFGTTYYVRIEHTGAAPRIMNIQQFSLVVEYATENRVAVGGLRAASATAIHEFPLYTPAGVAGWAKAAATSYKILVRRPQRVEPYLTTVGTGGGDLGFGHIVGPTQVAGSTGLGIIAPSSSLSGMTYYVGNAQGSVTAIDPAPLAVGASPGWRLRVSGGSTSSVDSPEYASVVMHPVFTGNFARQEITAPASGTFAFGRVPLYAFPGDEPLNDLTVTVRRVSDSSLFGTATLTPQDYLAAPLLTGSSSWRMVTFALTSVVPLVAGTQYRVDFVSTTPASRPWVVQAVQPLTGAGEATYAGSGSGTVDAAWAGSARVSWRDTPVVLIVSPAGPTGLAATAGTEATNATGAGCSLECSPFVDVTWNSTSLAGAFLFYEIERRDDVDTAWEVVAVITDEAVETWRDREVRAGSGIESEYRIRAWRSDLVASEWAGPEAVVPTSCGPGYTFTSNVSDVVLGYVDSHGSSLTERSYSRPVQTIVREVYGRDGVVAFRPTERRFDEFEARLIVAAHPTVPAGGPGPRAFDEFRSLIEDGTLPYVCVRDESGSRYLAVVDLTGTGVLRLSGDPYHLCDVAVIEATRTPWAPTVDGP